MSKRIVIDARYLDGTYTGIATYSLHLVENLSRVDQENEYLVVVRPGFRANALTLGENFEIVTYRPKPIGWQSYFRFHDYLNDLQPDILHSLAPHAPIFYDGPLMVTVHDLQPFVDPDFSARRAKTVQLAYNLFYRWAYPTTLAKAKWIVCDSYATRDDVVRLLPGAVSKLIVVRPGLDLEVSDKPTEARIEAIRAKCHITGRYFLYYGSTRPNKNLPNLVKAFARLVRQSPETTADMMLVLVLRKDRFFRDVQRAINSRKLQNRVVVLDPLKWEEKQALLAGALAFVFPTKYEGFGFPPLEAMRAGVPVMAGQSGALPEILEDAALMVHPDDVDDITRGLRQLADNEHLRQELVKRGHVQITKFDWRKSAEYLRDIYNLLF